MNNNYFIVDCHCHLYRTEKQGWQGRAINYRWDKGGTSEQLLRCMDELGIDQAWAINSWPTLGLLQAGRAKISKDLSGKELEEAEAGVVEDVRGKLERANEWLSGTAAATGGRFIPFIGLDPYWGPDWMVGELEDKNKKGAKGVKLIPTWGEFYPNDRRMWPAYAKMAELGMVMLSHSGGSDTLFEVGKTDYAMPRNWADVLSDFPNLKVVLAHLGYAYGPAYGPELQKERYALAERFPNVYFDLSWVNEHGYTAFQVNMIRHVGVDRCVWGTDWHAHRSAFGLVGLLQSALTEDEKRKILGENARRLTE
jgi:predicted TIM-barrel fold metal-dependent hydrolase